VATSIRNAAARWFPESDRVGRSGSLTVLYTQNGPRRSEVSILTSSTSTPGGSWPGPRAAVHFANGHEAAVLSARQTQVQRVRLAFNERDR
jgi:hypothetical protein